MAQATTGITRAGFKVEVSTDGSSWTDISGMSATVTPSGGDQLVGEQMTADGELPIVVAGLKTAAMQLQVNCVYTETASQPWQIVATRYLGAIKTIYLRYSPAGGATGEFLYTCVNDAGSAFACPIVNCLPPEVDASTGDVAMFTFTVTTPGVAQSTIA